jgi:hypothetical protein
MGVAHRLKSFELPDVRFEQVALGSKRVEFEDKEGKEEPCTRPTCMKVC